ncbi:hypothetical protein [Psychroflexus salarius]|nr:hypothetical protein [Psychroflexus salarius]
MLVVLCFFLFSCDESESITQDASLNYQKNYLESNYIEYQDALNVSNKLVDE